MANTSDILNRLIASLTSQDPTWDVSIGTAEYKILEAVAQEIASASNNNTLQNYSFDITTKSGRDLDNFCAIFGIYRDGGKSATGTATFYTSSSGLASATLSIQNASAGTFSFNYTPTASTTIALSYNATASDIQSALTNITPTSSAVNVDSPSAGVFNITFTPPLVANSIGFDSSLLTGTNLSTSFVPAGGATYNYAIPAGSQVYASGQTTGTGAVYYQTTTPATLVQGSSSVVVPIQAIVPGTAGNLAAGNVNFMASSIAGITSVTNSILSGGVDPETDAQLRQRWQNTVFKNLAGTEDQFLALAFSNPSTSRAKVIGPQTQNVESIQIDTVFINSQKTGVSLNSGSSTSTTQNLSKTVTAATGAGVGTTSATYTLDDATGFAVGDFVMIEGITETTGASTSNSYNSSGLITAVTSGVSGTVTVSIPFTAAINVTGYTGATLTRLPNSIATSSTNTFQLNPQSSFSAPWTVNTGGTQATITVPSGSSSAGAIKDVSVISANGNIATSNKATVSSVPTTNSDGSTQIIVGGTATMSASSVANKLTFSVSVPTTTIDGASFTGSSTTITTASTSGFPSSGTISVPGSGGTLVFAYTGITNYNFTGCSLIYGTAAWTISNGATVSLVFSGTTKIKDMQSVISHMYNYTPSIDPSQVVTLNPFFNSGTVSITGTSLSGTFTVTSQAAIDAGTAATSLAYNVPPVTTASTTGLKNALNSLLSTYGIQCSVYRAFTATSSYVYTIDFYAKTYAHAIDSDGNNIYYYIPVDVSYVNSILVWDFTGIGGTSPKATWTYGYDGTGTVGQSAAVSMLYSKPAAMPLAYTKVGALAYDPNKLTYSVSSSIPNSQYFYPQGMESIESSTTVTGVSSVASPFVDYTYTANLVSPCRATATITNANNYSWLYPGNVVNFSYFYVDSASRNVPTTLFTGKGSTIYTNYVDVIVDGVTPQTVVEDGVINSTATVPLPGNGGYVTSTNKTNWLLGDGVSVPQEKDFYYVFSQQPATQPWSGLYPQSIALGPFLKGESVASSNTVASYPTTQTTITNTSYTDMTLTGNLKGSTVGTNGLLFGPATVTAIVSGTSYTIWYSAFSITGGNTKLLNCILLAPSGTTSVTIPSSGSNNVYQWTLKQSRGTTETRGFSMGDIGAYVTDNNIPSGTIVNAVAPGNRIVLSKAPTGAISSNVILSWDSKKMNAYAGPISNAPSQNATLTKYEWFPGNTPGTKIVPSLSSAFNADLASEPYFKNFTLYAGSKNATTTTNINPVYYNMVPNVNRLPYPTSVTGFSREGSTITLSNAASDKYNTINNVIMTSDYYPIYDATKSSGSTTGLHGIGIRQPVLKHRYATWASGSNFISDSNAIAMDLGCFVVVNNDTTSASFPQQAYIDSVTPGLGYTITFPSNPYGSSTISSTQSSATAITLIPFTTMPSLPTNVDMQLFSIDYDVNSAVRDVDSLVQQQRLIGVSTNAHAVNYQQILLNLSIVPVSGNTLNSISGNVTTQLNTYFNNLQFGSPIQVSSIIQAAMNVQGVQNVKLATTTDSANFYGIQVVNPYMYYDSMADVTQGNVGGIDFQDLVVLNTYTGDVILASDQLPQLFYVNIYMRSEGDF